MTLRHSRGRRPAHRMRTPSACQLVAAAADHVLVEAHQEAHLLGRPPPVLGRERVGRDGRDAQLDRAVQHVHQRRLAGAVALGAGQPALVGPAAVAVHDDRDVLGHELGRDVGRRRPGRVRRRIGPRAVARRGYRARILGRLRPVELDRSGQRSTSGSARRPRSRCHCRWAATSPLASRRSDGSVASAVGPVTAEQRRHQRDRRRLRTGRAGRAAVLADRAAGGDVERRVRAGLTALGALEQGRLPPGGRHRPQQEGVEDQARGRARARPGPAARRPAAGTAAAPARPPRSAARPSRRSPTPPSSAG